MSTGPIGVDLDAPAPTLIEEAGRILRAGGLIVHPTDTIFGLAVDPRQAAGVERLRELKGRSADRPFILLIDGPGRALELTEDTPKYATDWMSTIWPAPLTLILKARPGIPGIAPDGSVALRWPAQPLTLALVAEAGGLMASTSANRAGEAPVANGAQAWQVFGAGPLGVDMVMVDWREKVASTPGIAGRTDPIPRLESTIIDCREARPRVVRVGSIGLDRLGLPPAC